MEKGELGGKTGKKGSTNILGDASSPRSAQIEALTKAAEAIIQSTVSTDLHVPFMDRARDEVDPVEAGLSKMIGMEGIKVESRQLKLRVDMDQLRIQTGLGPHGADAPNNSRYHLCLMGNPGTGKTSVARLYAEILHRSGVLPTNQVVEVQRQDLVGRYVGHTAPQTRACINKAKGGVLFVDEAYRLSGAGSEKDFGLEAIETLMEDLTTGDPVLVIAGYPAEMEHFLEVNPGLERRIETKWRLPDYSPAEIAQMFFEYVAAQGFTISEEGGPAEGPAMTQEVLARLIESETSLQWRNKRNGAIKELLYKRVVDQLNQRLHCEVEGKPTKEQLWTIRAVDIQRAVKDLQKDYCALLEAKFYLLLLGFSLLLIISSCV